MRLRYGFLVTTMIVLLGLVLPAPAGAAWREGNEFAWRDERVCRDGIVLTGAAENPQHAPTKTARISVRLLDTTVFPAPPGPDYLPLHFYGPLLAPPQTITMTYYANQDKWLPADFDDDGVADKVFHTYALNNRIRWSRLLDVGARVVLDIGFGATYVVENCFMHRLTLDRGATSTVTRNALAVDDGTDPRQMRYRLIEVPARGQLRLAGQPLAAGAVFTQYDIDANRLTYTHDGSQTTSDSFVFSVAGTTRVSVSAEGTQSGGGSTPAMSGDANRVAFASTAGDLTPGDRNGVSDIFVRDRPGATTSRVSAGGNGASSAPSVAGDGQVVAFQSSASNLVADDTNARPDIFLAPVIRRVSVTTAEQQSNGNSYAPSLAMFGASAIVAFQSSATNLVAGDTVTRTDVFVRDQSQTRRVSTALGWNGTQANGHSYNPAIAAWKGDVVAFDSVASNLVSGDSNRQRDVFVSDVQRTVRVSVNQVGTQGNGPSYAPAMSPTGRFVAYVSRASNLIGGDTNGKADIFVRDRDADGDGIMDERCAIPDEVCPVSTRRISVRTGGAQANGDSAAPSISADGRYIAFESLATNLVPGDTNGKSDIFVHDRMTGRTIRASVRYSGSQTNGNAHNPSISSDGSYVAFDSDATNLVAGDTNQARDVFVRYLGFSSRLVLAIRPGGAGAAP